MSFLGLLPGTKKEEINVPQKQTKENDGEGQKFRDVAKQPRTVNWYLKSTYLETKKVTAHATCVGREVNGFGLVGGIYRI